MFLILGANGQLGSIFKEFYGKEAIGLGREELDVTVIEDVKDKLLQIRPHTVINCASLTSVDKAEREPQKAYLVDVIGASNVAQVCKEIGAITIYLSTNYIFDGKSSQPYTESCVAEPINTYGSTKLSGEAITATNNESHYIIRTSWLFGGPGPHNFVEAILSKVKQLDTTLCVVMDQYGTPTHCRDLVEVVNGLLANGCKYGIYHITNSGHVNLYQFVKWITIVSEMSYNIVPITSDEYYRVYASGKEESRRPKFAVLDNGLIQSLGFSLRNWDSAVKEYLEKRKG